MKRLDGRSRFGKQPYVNWDTHVVSVNEYRYIGGFEYVYLGHFWWADMLYNDDPINVFQGCPIMRDFMVRRSTKYNWQ